MVGPTSPARGGGEERTGGRAHSGEIKRCKAGRGIVGKFPNRTPCRFPKLQTCLWMSIAVAHCMVCEPVVCTTCCAVPCCVGCGPLPPSDISEHLLNHQVPPGPSLWNFHDEDSFEVSQPMSWMFQVEGVAVGFMSLCSRVNLQLLHECFDLGPFHGLCTPHPNDVLEPSPELSAQGIPGKVACTGARCEC